MIWMPLSVAQPPNGLSLYKYSSQSINYVYHTVIRLLTHHSTPNNAYVFFRCLSPHFIRYIHQPRISFSGKRALSRAAESQVGMEGQSTRIKRTLSFSPNLRTVRPSSPATSVDASRRCLVTQLPSNRTSDLLLATARTEPKLQSSRVQQWTVLDITHQPQLLEVAFPYLPWPNWTAWATTRKQKASNTSSNPRNGNLPVRPLFLFQFLSPSKFNF